MVAIHFGGIPDLTPLAEVPGLRAVWLYQIRKLDTDDLGALGGCKSLVVVSVGALRNVTHLGALTRGPRHSLRYLILERMLGLETLAHLSDCDALEQVYLDEASRRTGALILSHELRHYAT